MRENTDWMEQYSHPVEVRQTKLAQVYSMPVRQRPERPGRTLTVMWDERFPLVGGFRNRYSYVVRFDGPGSTAGNHFHHQKHELFIALAGRMTVTLEDTGSKDRETIEIDADRAEFVEVKPPLAHAVTADTDGCMLLVVASSAETIQDDFPYKLV